MTSEPYVLIVSTIVDVATDEVVTRLTRRGVNFQRVNTEQYPFHSTLAFQPGSECSNAWMYVNAEWRPEPSSVWYRRVRVPTRPENMDPGIYEFCLRETRASLLGGLMSSKGRWMSHPEMV